MARTTPPERITTGTTSVAWAGKAPIDGYTEEVKSNRPVAYFESNSTATTAATSSPTMYVKQTITAGMCGRLSAAAAHFQTHIAGAMSDNTYGICSWVQIDGGSTITGGGDGGVITPLSVGVRERVTSTHTSSQVVFGIQAQALFTNDTPTKVYFARCNVMIAGSGATGVTALFYGDNRLSLGIVEGSVKTGAFGYCKFAEAQGQVLYVNLYSA